MATVYAIVNQKGGVGKTTTASCLGTGLALEGKRVLMIDADPQGDLTALLGIRNQDELENTLATSLEKAMDDDKYYPSETIITNSDQVDIIPSNIDLASYEMNIIGRLNRERGMAMLVDRLRDDYDYIIIDCPPTLGMLTINALSSADKVLIPIQAQILATRGTNALLKTVADVKKHINPNLEIDGMLLTMIDGRVLSHQAVRELVKHQFGKDINVFDVEIHDLADISNSQASGKTIYDYRKSGEAAKVYKKLVSEIMNRNEEVSSKKTEMIR